MENNMLFHGRYHLERLLGRGNFSEVWLAKDTKSNIDVAIKIYVPTTGLDDHGIDIFAREFALVASVSHKNLMGPLHYDSCDRKPYLILPYCKNGSIAKKIGTFTEEQTWQLLRDVASGLAWLHSLNPPLIHQDIKPDNIMFGENGNFVLTDFGVSTHLRATMRKSMSQAFTSAGTTAYMAPERFSKNNTPIMANDIYSLGVTAYEMLTGEVPFGEDGGLLQNKGAEIPEIQADCSETLKKTISLCLQRNPWDRPTAEQLAGYAETALQGKKVHFVGEKSFLEKYRKVLLPGIAILIAAIATICVISYNKHERNELVKLAIALQEQQQADSVQVEAFLYYADSLELLGDAHDAYYENYYIEAYACLMAAQELYRDTAQLFRLEEQLKTIRKKLQTSKEELQQKAILFADDEEISADFNERVNNISLILPTANDSLQTIYTDSIFEPNDNIIEKPSAL